ncbi:MAG: transglutaminase-like domain-containing protein [Patescibacteria group bacterium]
MRKIFFFILFVFILLSFFSPNAEAASDFSTNYNVRYQVSNNQNTHVQLSVSLSNKTDNYYASSYKIHVGFNDIRNVKAADGEGNILTGITKGSDDQIISVTFNQKIVGLNNKLNFTISFDTPEVARHLGKIWEINIPGLNSESDISDFNVQVLVPQSFGNPSFIKPNVRPTANGNSYSFSKDTLKSSGISMTFGNEQIYQLNLTYHLYNKNLFPVKTEIALPPDTNYQKVQIENISPKPENVTIDKDGNWLAQYILSPSSKKDIIVNQKVKLGLTPAPQIESQATLSNYLKDKKYWESSNQIIKNKAKELKTPYDIYKFVSGYLTYDYSRVATEKPRLGALKTFSSPASAVCLEFTDLFIAIARAAGIPAREVDGFAYTQNTKERPLSLVKDILHAWPQYYDKDRGTWVMVDPTWANTTGGLDYFNTLDFDHITFVIKGMESDYPVPAGGYKLPDGENLRDVNVAFASGYAEKNPLISVVDNLPDKLISGFSSGGSVIIKNTGEVISPPQAITIQTSFLTPADQTIRVDSIPPYGQKVIPVNFNKTPFLTNRRDEIKISVAGSVLTHQIKIIPFFLTQLAILTGGVIIFAGILVISIIAFKPWNLSFFKRKE